MDYQVICDQFERSGRAIIVSLKGKPSFGQITEKPEIGEAVPWYGDVGTGYEYRLLPNPDGYLLKVRNLASEHRMLCRETLPPYEIHVPKPVALHQNGNSSQGKERNAGYAFSEDKVVGEITYCVTPDIFPILAAWSWYGEPISRYEFIFAPLTIGNLVSVRHIESDEVIDLTKNIEW